MTVEDLGTLLVATRSVGKMAEIRRILSALPGLRVIDLDEAGVAFLPEEDELEPYETFEENARSKAEYFHRRSGLLTVADDSGIVVDALDGAPGVRSKRFAPDDPEAPVSRDEANNRYLVERLRDVSEDRRTARYVCVAAVVDRQGVRAMTRGEAEGRIVEVPRGKGGFGYDPHMYVPELDRTFAELSPEEKDARSHRGAAFRALARELAGDREVRP